MPAPHVEQKINNRVSSWLGLPQVEGVGILLSKAAGQTLGDQVVQIPALSGMPLPPIEQIALLAGSGA